MDIASAAPTALQSPGDSPTVETVETPAPSASRDVAVKSASPDPPKVTMRAAAAGRRPANEPAPPWSTEGGVQAPVFAPAVTFEWIVRLRWGAVFAQAVTVLVAAAVLDGKLQTQALTAIVTLSAASNLGLHAWMRAAERRVRHRVIGAVLMTDVVLFTALLYFSGGPSNPFSVLYLVYVALAALALGIRWALALVAVAAAGYLVLFFAHVPVEGMDHAHPVREPSAFSMHLQAMWVAFAVSASLIAFVVARLQRALQERDERLAQVWFVAARSEKLASLTTLAAGAAHELGTPLATIAVASKDLEKALKNGDARSPLAEDARLIRKEVERCRWIVEQMSGRSGEFMGEALDVIAVDELERRLRDKAVSAERLVFEVDPAVPRRLVVPVRGLLQTLGNLIVNGLEATAESEDARVVLGIRRTEDALQFEVIDRGAGIPESQLARAGEPFFSTRAPGKGMGLGLFLARTFAQEWHGRLYIESKPGYGTRVRIELPLLAEGGH